MVLTDRQRADLHSGIYEYLSSLEGFQQAAEAFAKADPVAASSVVTNGTRKNGSIPLLEKKWTAIPRLQKKVLELERQAAHNAQIHAHRAGAESAGGGGSRRMLPRLPCAHTLQGHAASVTCVALHPVYTMVVSGSEDGTIKVGLHKNARVHKEGKKYCASLQMLTSFFVDSGLGPRKWRIFANTQGTYQYGAFRVVFTHWKSFSVVFVGFGHQVMGFVQLYVCPHLAWTRSYH